MLNQLGLSLHLSYNIQIHLDTLLIPTQLKYGVQIKETFFGFPSFVLNTKLGKCDYHKIDVRTEGIHKIVLAY